MKMLKSLVIGVNHILCVVYIYNGRFYNTKTTVYESNFGTAYEVYKDAVKIDSSIWLQDVKYYLSKPDSVQAHFKYKK